MPEELTSKNNIEILSVLYGPYGCTTLIGKKECEAMQKAIASVLDGDMDPRPNLRAPHITPNDADCKGCPERQNQGLAWTTEPPTVPGWYWWCFARDIVPHMVYVVWESTLRKTDNDHLLVLYPNCNEEFLISERGGHWAGPIPRPEEAV